MESYPSIFSTHHRYVNSILSAPVVIQEKIDGSQFNFELREDGTVRFRSKGAEILSDQPPKMFKAAVEYITSITHNLNPGWSYHGEVLQKPKHNVLCYDKVPPGNVILFDISMGGYNYASPERLADYAAYLGLWSVPTFYEGMLTSWELPKALLENVSILGGCKVEGVVIKSRDLFGLDKKPLMAKIVREEFKEAHMKEWKAGPGTIQKIIEALGGTMRWEKAVQHLEELDLLVNAPQDIGPLLREINQDVMREEGDWIKEKLFEDAWKQIARGVTAGFPEWYKERISKGEQDEVSQDVPSI